MLLTLVLVGSACVAVAVAVVLAVVLIAVRGEDRRMSLKDDRATRLEAAVRRLLGVGVRLGRTGAPCRDCSRWVSPARPPHPACASPRTGRSTCLAR